MDDGHDEEFNQQSDPPLSEPVVQWLQKEVDISELAYVVPLVILGTLSNVCVLWVWSLISSDRRRTTPTIYLFRALAVADLFYLLSYPPTCYLNVHNYYLRVFLCIVCFGNRILSIYITLMLAVVRFVMVFHPLKAERMLAPDRLKLTLALLAVFSLTLQAMMVVRLVLVPGKYYWLICIARATVGLILPAVVQNVLMFMVLWKVWKFSKTLSVTMEEVNKQLQTSEHLILGTDRRERPGSGNKASMTPQWRKISTAVDRVTTAFEKARRRKMSTTVDRVTKALKKARQRKMSTAVDRVTKVLEKARQRKMSTAVDHVNEHLEVARQRKMSTAVDRVNISPSKERALQTISEVDIDAVSKLGSKSRGSSSHAHHHTLGRSALSESSMDVEKTNLEDTNSLSVSESMVTESEECNNFSNNVDPLQFSTSSRAESPTSPWLSGILNFSPKSPDHSAQEIPRGFHWGLVFTTFCICLTTFVTYPVCSLISILFYHTSLMPTGVLQRICVVVKLVNSGINIVFYASLQSFRHTIISKAKTTNTMMLEMWPSRTSAQL